MTIGERIYYCRVKNHMTQKELGDKAGIDPSTIRKYESGRLNPKIGTLRKIADALGCKVTDLDDSLSTATSEAFSEAYKSVVGTEVQEKLVASVHDLLQSEFGTTDINEVTPVIFSRWFKKLDYADKENVRVAFGHLQHLNSIGKQIAADRLGELQLIEKYTEPEPPKFISEEEKSAAQNKPAGQGDGEPETKK